MATTTVTQSQLSAFLQAIRDHESGTTYTAQSPGSSASGAYQFEDATWAEYAAKAGYSQYANKPAKTAPSGVQNAVAAYMATTYFKGNGGTWGKVAQSWYSPANVGKTSVVPYPTAGNSETMGDYSSAVLATMNTVLSNGGATTVSTSLSSGTSLASAEGVATSSTAQASVDAVLKKAGLTTLLGWAKTQIKSLAATGLSGSAIATALATKIYTTPAFKARFPGMTLRTQNGYSAITVTQYLTYENTAKSMAEAAGLPAGFMSKTEIAQLIGNTVSPSELTHRITKGYEAAMNSPAETRQLLTSYFGIKTGTLAAYFLTPKRTTGMLTNQLTAAQIGTAGVTSGFTLPKPGPTATLGKVTPTGKPTTTPGKAAITALYLAQMGVSQSTASDTFQALSKLLPLTEGLPGTGGEQTSLSQNDLLGFGFFGTNNEELSNVEQARTAPFRGGGGYVQSARGVLGAGYGNSSGTTGT